MKKRLAAVLLAATSVALLLAGCTSTPAPENPKTSNAKGMSPDRMVTILYSGSTLAPGGTVPKKGKYYFWSPGDKTLSDKGRYSVTYPTLTDTKQIGCFEDTSTYGALKVITDTTKLYTDYEVSLKGSCNAFTTDSTFRGNLTGPGNYDITVVAQDKNKITPSYVKALQDYEDKMKASDPSSK